MITRKPMISIFSGGRLIVLLFALFFLLAGWGMRYMQKANDENAWRLDHEGETSIATITNKRIETSHTTNKNAYAKASGSKHYTLEYTFSLVDSNKVWQGDDDVSEEDFNSVEIGDQFDVLYWRENPDIATILENGYSEGAQLARNISMFCFGLAALMIIIMLLLIVRKK